MAVGHVVGLKYLARARSPNRRERYFERNLAKNSRTNFARNEKDFKSS